MEGPGEDSNSSFQRWKPLPCRSDVPLCTSRSDVERYLLSLVDKLYDREPNHPIFGPCAKHLVRAPYIAEDRSNGVSWRSYLSNIANRDGFLLPPTVGYNQCWLINGDVSLKIISASTYCRSVKIVRILAFFKEPTTTNWAALCSEGSKPSDIPFDHLCGRGEHRPDQLVYRCINGIEHGAFNSRAVNEERKKCAFGAVCLCPGHGDPKTKCIFTGPDGILRPCLNNPVCVPACEHHPRCY
jgi:hypothetical protein